MINRVVLVGRLTRDPELRRTGSGNSVCSFTVAVDNRQKNPDGTRGTTFVPCVCFQQSADNMVRFVRKGALVGVEGRLNQRSYQRQDGTNAKVFEVLCDSVQFLEPKGDNANEDVPTFDDQPVEEAGKNLDTLDLPDDDLPF
jgi:single-strand DNA-binding protein